MRIKDMENNETITNKDVALSKGSLKIVAGSLCGK